MGVCGAMLLAGLVLGARWSTLPFESPPPIDAPRSGEVARRFAWYCSLLLARRDHRRDHRDRRRRAPRHAPARGHGRRRRAGPDHRGRRDRRRDHRRRHDRLRRVQRDLRWRLRRGALPRWSAGSCRRAGLAGSAFGAGLLVVLGTTIDPLRDENPDFDIVGPGWLVGARVHGAGARLRRGPRRLHGAAQRLAPAAVDGRARRWCGTSPWRPSPSSGSA